MVEDHHQPPDENMPRLSISATLVKGGGAKVAAAGTTRAKNPLDEPREGYIDECGNLLYKFVALACPSHGMCSCFLSGNDTRVMW